MIFTNATTTITTLLPKLAGHLELTGIALLAGTLTACLLALLCRIWPRIRPPVLTLISLLQTIPSLALLAMMVPLTGQFGFVPAVCALTLYSVLPIVQNILLGFDSIHPNLREAGLAVGMKPWQRLFWIDIPLTLPFGIAGLRTAAVWTVGAATLSTPVGQTSLGNLIFTGLQIRQWDLVLLGCIAAAILAIVVDHLLHFCGLWWQQGAFQKTALGLMLLIVLFASGPYLSSLALHLTAMEQNLSLPHAMHPTPPQSINASKQPTIAIGSKSFTEQLLLANLLEQQLKEHHLTVERIDGLGSTMILEALAQDTIQIYVDYLGTLWAHGMQRHDRPPYHRIKGEITGWLAQRDIELFAPLGFENAYAIFTHQQTAQRYHLKTIEDLRPYNQQWRIAGDYEIFQRQEWRSFKSHYQLQFAQENVVDPTFLQPILQRQQVELLVGFTTDGGLQNPNIVQLEDTLGSLPPYQAYILLSPKAALNPHIRQALEPLSNSISTEQMRSANHAVEQLKQSVAQVARQLLEQSRQRMPHCLPKKTSGK